MGLKVGGVGQMDEGGVPFPPGSRRGALVIGVIITCLLSSFHCINTEKYPSKID